MSGKTVLSYIFMLRLEWAGLSSLNRTLIPVPMWPRSDCFLVVWLSQITWNQTVSNQIWGNFRCGSEYDIALFSFLHTLSEQPKDPYQNSSWFLHHYSMREVQVGVTWQLATKCVQEKPLCLFTLLFFIVCWWFTCFHCTITHKWNESVCTYMCGLHVY